ncbi:MAG: hypothetical protein R2818_15710 [Flavobacteriales bacterium]
MSTHTEQQRLERLLLGQENVMEEVHHLLMDEQKQDDLLRAMVLSSTKELPVHIHGFDPDRVYHRDSIRALCVRYRLRFLPGGLFKGSIPNPAVHAIRALERKVDGHLRSFMIMAPASRFKLCDSEVDPLLFVPLGSDHYYLVHKWGTDLSWSRRFLNWPLRSPVHLATLVLLVASLLTIVFPTPWLNGSADASFWSPQRLLLLFWTTTVCTSFTVFGWFAFFGQFSTEAWNSRYFN